MKKSGLFVLVILTILSLPLFADEAPVRTIEIDTSDLSGKARIGVALGYPSAITFGYKSSSSSEWNIFAGSHFTGFSVGGSLLFTILQLNIEGENLPLSLGPALFVHLDGLPDLSVLMPLRIQYDFREIPLNLYLEAGPGISFINGVYFRWTSSLGIRYIVP